MLIAVRNDVMKETERKQVPWEHSALTGRFFFGVPKPSMPGPLLPPPSREPRLLLQDGPATTLLTAKDMENVTARASKKGLPVPTFTIRTPAADTPRSMRRLIGIWISDEGFINSGRQFMLIFTNADKEGRVVGHVSRGPPQPKSFLREPAGAWHITALVENGAARWDNRDSKVSVFLTAQNQLEFREAFNDGRSGTVILKPVWTLVAAESAAKR